MAHTSREEEEEDERWGISEDKTQKKSGSNARVDEC